jgi:hypothetical protein
MKKAILFLVLSFMLTTFVNAQTPEYYNYGDTTAGSNTFPLGTSSGRMVQWLVLPGEFNHPSVSPSGNITKFYVLTAKSFGPFTYSNVNLLLGQATLTALPTSAFYTGTRDTVYNRATVSLSGTPLTWLEFTLDHPFVYDNTKSLIIQLEHRGASGSASYIHAHTLLTGKRRTYSNVSNPFGVQGQDAWALNCGVTLTATGVEPSLNLQIPNEYSLEQNYPNPFNPVTKINFDLPKSGFVTLKVYDILGKEVATLLNDMKNAGSYNVDFDGASFSSGMYYYKLESNGFVSTKKMMLIK